MKTQIKILASNGSNSLVRIRNAPLAFSECIDEGKKILFKDSKKYQKIKEGLLGSCKVDKAKIIKRIDKTLIRRSHIIDSNSVYFRALAVEANRWGIKICAGGELQPQKKRKIPFASINVSGIQYFINSEIWVDGECVNICMNTLIEDPEYNRYSKVIRVNFINYPTL